MPHKFSALTFTDDVAEVQRQMGSRNANEKLTERGPANDTFGPDERTFIAARDGFYIATIGTTGWPYIQFRGGPIGFLDIRDDRTLAYADVTGNRQYITTGNLHGNHRASLFFMDYPNQTRLKLLADIETIPWSEAPAWKTDLKRPEPSRPERVVLIHLAAFDWNCPQHIPQRWTVEELKRTSIFERIEALEEENRDLRAALAKAHPATAT
jgi:predicted pyridoxine 5'-phosphate oxidase superfamily flavin-nucleotide-binding protein